MNMTLVEVLDDRRGEVRGGRLATHVGRADLGGVDDVERRTRDVVGMGVKPTKQSGREGTS
jgi:hypothetical protein